MRWLGLRAISGGVYCVRWRGYEVEGRVAAYRLAQLGGPPDARRPAEGGDVELLRVRGPAGVEVPVDVFSREEREAMADALFCEAAEDA